MTDALIHRLRSYSEAYPLDMFPELTKEEREMLRREHPGLLDRISASMGRHCGKIMDQAADAIERIPEQQKPAHEREPPHCSSCSCGKPCICSDFQGTNIHCPQHGTQPYE